MYNSFLGEGFKFHPNSSEPFDTATQFPVTDLDPTKASLLQTHLSELRLRRFPIQTLDEGPSFLLLVVVAVNVCSFPFHFVFWV